MSERDFVKILVLFGLFILLLSVTSCVNHRTPDYYREYDLKELRKIEMDIRLRKCRAEPYCAVNTVL